MIRTLILLVETWCLLTTTIDAFSSRQSSLSFVGRCGGRLTTTVTASRCRRPSTLLCAKQKKKSKGFGKVVVEEPPPSSPVQPTAATAVQQQEAQEEELNAGQRALQQMRRERAEQKDAELRQLRELRQQDEQQAQEAAVIPEQVATRMGQRMLPFVGIPLFLGMGSFVGFWYLVTYKDMELPTSMVAIVTIGILVIGLLGITYSVMSASWDPDREGDLLGADEFQKNVKNVQDGLSRSRDNTLLREKIAGLDETEVTAALDDLARREASQAKKSETLESKIQQELE